MLRTTIPLSRVFISVDVECRNPSPRDKTQHYRTGRSGSRCPTGPPRGSPRVVSASERAARVKSRGNDSYYRKTERTTNKTVVGLLLVTDPCVSFFLSAANAERDSRVTADNSTTFTQEDESLFAAVFSRAAQVFRLISPQRKFRSFAIEV